LPVVDEQSVLALDNFLRQGIHHLDPAADIANHDRKTDELHGSAEGVALAFKLSDAVELLG
jgi:hypothetical protein